MKYNTFLTPRLHSILKKSSICGPTFTLPSKYSKELDVNKESLSAKTHKSGSSTRDHLGDRKVHQL